MHLASYSSQLVQVDPWPKSALSNACEWPRGGAQAGLAATGTDDFSSGHPPYVEGPQKLFKEFEQMTS